MIKVISVKNMRDSDANEIKSRTPSLELMWKAAEGVFNSVEWRGKIGIVCGTGNNAGDGFALAILLKRRGIKSRILLVEERFSDDGLHYFKMCQDACIPYEIVSENTTFDFDIVVDCLLGTGFSGEPKEKIAHAIDKINKSKAYVVSVDINSGLNGNNGLSTVSVKSDLTVSIGQYKYGHFLGKAMDLMKNKANSDIGIEPIYEPAYLLEIDDVRRIFSKRKHESNKGDYGYVGILGGSSKYPGAPLLASMGQHALYAGCGVSRVIVPDSIASLVYARTLETTVFPMSSKDGDMAFNEESLLAATKGLKAVSVGMGWGVSEENEKILGWLLSNIKSALIIDADGLNVLSKMDLGVLKSSKAKILITPHLKEFSRLCDKGIEEIKGDPVGLAEEFALKYGVCVLLKGPTTTITDGKETYLVDRGTPGMATAGSGDVLSGILAGLFGYSKESVAFTAACGAFVNGMAGEMASREYGDIAMVSSDTARCVSKVIKELSE